MERIKKFHLVHFSSATKLSGRLVVGMIIIPLFNTFATVFS